MIKPQAQLCITQTFIAPATDLFTAAGGQGGTTSRGSLGGLGATVAATVFLEQGAIVPIIVVGKGGSGNGTGNFNTPPAGGGGLPAVYTASQSELSIVAGTVSSLQDMLKVDNDVVVCH